MNGVEKLELPEVIESKVKVNDLRIHQEQLLIDALENLEIELLEINQLILVVEEVLPIESENRELFAQSNVTVNSLLWRTQHFRQSLVESGN